MKLTRKTTGDNWQLDGTTIIVQIPMTFARRGSRKVIVAPDGGDAWAPAKPRPDETLIPALGAGAPVEKDAGRWDVLLGQ